MFRVSIEDVNTCAVSLDARFADLQTAMDTVASMIPNVRDLDFLCLDLDNNQHCRFFAGIGRDGSELAATICDHGYCVNAA